jgi:hypothetical protein
MVWWTLFGVVIFSIGLVLWWSVQHVRWRQLNADNQEALQVLRQIKSEVVKKKQALGILDSQNQATELTRLRNLLSTQHDWVDLMQKGDLGTVVGPSQLLTTLASVNQDSLWLERIDLSKSGQSLVLMGAALRLESVLQFANQLNAQLKDRGQFFSLETHQEVVSINADGSQKAAIIRFKLY